MPRDIIGVKMKVMGNSTSKTFRTTVADLTAELDAITDINNGHGLPAAAAHVLVDNYTVRYADVCDDIVGVETMALEHFIKLGNDVVSAVVAGRITATKGRARACKVLQYALNELERNDLTEAVMTKLGKVAAAMEDWCEAMEVVS